MKRLLCVMLLGFVFSMSACGAKSEAPVVLKAYDGEGNELPLRELSDDEVEEMIGAPTLGLSMDDLAYFFATDASFLDYATTSTPDFRNELAKAAEGAKEIEGTEDYELFDLPYLEGPAISMEHFADMVDFYKDHHESVALLIYYEWSPFRSEAYERKFEAYASSFERADVWEYWGEPQEFDQQYEGAETTLGEALDAVPVGQYDHLLLVTSAGALKDAEMLARIRSRDDFQEVIILTYDAASLRSCPDSAAVLAEKFGVTPILRPLMAWEVESSE